MNREKIIEIARVIFPDAEYEDIVLLAETILSSQWISVEDRLPEDQNDVILYIGDPWLEIGIGFYSKQGNWYYGDDRDCLVRVTHWQPVAPPRDEIILCSNCTLFGGNPPHCKHPDNADMVVMPAGCSRGQPLPAPPEEEKDG